MLRLGIVGCGRVTTMFHVNAIQSLDDFKITAVSDTSDSRMAEVQTQCNAKKTYKDYKELLKDQEVEAVAINTPPMYHEEMVLEALASGKHVICEKPLSKTVDGCIRIKEAQEDFGLIVLPAHNYVFSPSMLQMESMVKAGEIGKLKHVEVYFENNLKLYRSRTNFRTINDTGVVEDVLPHIVSVATPFTGKAIEIKDMTWRCKEYKVCDNLEATLITDRGLEIESSMSWTKLIPQFLVNVFGEEGSLRTDLMISPYTVTIIKNGKKRIIKNRGLDWYLDLIRFRHPSFQNQYRHFEMIIKRLEEPRITVDDEVAFLRLMEKVSKRMEVNQAR